MVVWSVRDGHHHWIHSCKRIGWCVVKLIIIGVGVVVEKGGMDG